MSAADKDLRVPGNFVTVRSIAGVAATDSTDYTNGAYVDAGTFRGGGTGDAWLYWTGTGGAITDTVTIELLTMDDNNSRWVALGAAISLRKDQAIAFPVRGASKVFPRIHAQATTCTALIIRAAKALPLNVA